MNSQGIAKIKLPDSPGVYFFLGKSREILYIGKATSLRSRVKSYFMKNLSENRGRLIIEMVEKARGVKFQKTNSVLEALLLEAELIKKHKPYYNTAEKDDKSFNCVVITDEDFPQVLVVRQKNLSGVDSRWSTTTSLTIHDSRLGNENSLSTFDFPLLTTYGPFPHGGELTQALKIIRRIFPYRDAKCSLPKNLKISRNATEAHSDVLENIRMGRPCFNRQIGLCPGTCTGEISRKDYAKTIRNIKLLFEGKVSKLISSLGKEMKLMAKSREFEKANEIKKTIFALEHIQDVSLLKSGEVNFSSAMVGVSSASVPRRWRIEGYDAGHFGGRDAVGVMTVIENGEVNKNEYRKFILQNTTGGDDLGALREVLTRRLKHTEWTWPNIVVIDGGLAQKSVAEKLFMEIKQEVQVVAVVKDERHKPKSILGDEAIVRIYKKLILLVNNEAHRFAIKFHRHKRKLNFLS